MPPSWARRLIAAGHAEMATLPRYGDAAWAALADTSSAKVAAVVIAAECWRIESHPATIADRLRAQLAAEHIVAEKLEDEDFAAMAAGVRRMAGSPTYNQLKERRDGERGSRPGDYPGRAGGAYGVEWSTGKWLRRKGFAA